jgi:hypothetical protein
MTNVQSVITTPATPAPKGNGKGKAKLNGTTAHTSAAMTSAQACDIAFEAGQNYAGQDGSLTLAFTTFAANETVINDMVYCIEQGYFVRKMAYTRDESKRVINLKKYNHMNPQKNTAENRTKEQETVMGAVRVLVSRAKRMAGITKPADQNAEVARAAKEATAKAHESRLIKADEIVNPKDDTDVFDALNRLVLTMKSLQKKFAAKLVDDRGSEWRDWLANAPR